MKQNIIYVVLSVLILGGVGAGAYFYTQSQEEEAPELGAVDRPLSAYTQGQQTPLDSSLQVQSGVEIPETTNQVSAIPSLPSPAEFGQYEQYRNNETALFVDAVEGQGEQVQLNDTVDVIYKGWLTSGQTFDESRVNAEGLLEPFVFQLGAGNVIQGWEQTILGMKVGGQRRLIIPPQLGYGQSGQGSIPPNAMLIFDVELVAREPQQSQ